MLHHLLKDTEIAAWITSQQDTEIIKSNNSNVWVQVFKALSLLLQMVISGKHESDHKHIICSGEDNYQKKSGRIK